MKKSTLPMMLFAALILTVWFPCQSLAQLPSLEMPLKTTDAPEWDEIFIRTSGEGWYSGDGIFMVPFSGDDSQGQKLSTKTLILFSDSHTCTSIDPESYIVSGDKMMNHAIGVLSPLEDPDKPQFSDVEYHWGEDDNKRQDPEFHRNIFLEHAWAMDGIYQKDTIHMFMTVEENGDGVSGVSMVHIPIVNDDIDLSNSASLIEPTAFFYKEGTSNTRLGSAVMDNTSLGNAHTPDGFVYVYGVRKVGTRRGAVVARVLKQNFTNFSKYKFWNGSSWTTDFMDLVSDEAEIFTHVSSDRYSVTQIHTGPFAGKYMAIYSRKLSQPIVEYKIADTPVGPWSEGVPVWGIVKELDELGPNVPDYYGAKAHPHLSEPGELLVSYCVNSYQPSIKDHNKNRGRFFRIDLNNFAEEAPQFIVSHIYNKTYASGFTNALSKHTKAFNSNARDEYKWQDDTPGDKWISIDLGQDYYIDRWQLFNEGQLTGNSNLNTKDFQLQFSDDNNSWTTLDGVVGNTADIYNSVLPETKARYWRVYITAASQDGSDIANVLNINLFGRTNPKPVAEEINLVKNFDFETGDLTSWNSWNNSINTDTDHVFEGSHSGKIIGDKSGSIKQFVELEPNTQYIATVWAKVSNTEQIASFLINDVSTGKIRATINSTEFEKYQLAFSTGENDQEASISVYKGSKSVGEVYVDNYSIIKASSLKSASKNSNVFDVEKESQLSVYPNPANSIFHIELNEMGLSMVRIYNIEGALVYQSQALNTLEVQINHLFPKGVYLVKVVDSLGKIHSAKLVIDKS